MSTEPMLFDLAPLVTPDYTPDLTLSERFAIFHEANPHVANALETLAAQWFAAGNRRIGAKSLAERLRWESGLSTVGDAYRINNSLVSHYARLLIERHPDWSDRIETRQLRAA